MSTSSHGAGTTHDNGNDDAASSFNDESQAIVEMGDDLTMNESRLGERRFFDKWRAFQGTHKTHMDILGRTSIDNP